MPRHQEVELPGDWLSLYQIPGRCARLLCYVGKPTALEMAIKSEAGSEWIEETRIEVGRDILKLALVCPGIFALAVSAPLGLSSGCVDGNGARYWRLNEASLWDIEEIKSPCAGRGFGGIRSGPPHRATSLPGMLASIH